MRSETRIQDHLTFLYGAEEAERIWPRLLKRLSIFRENNPDLQAAAAPGERLTERDAFLITYGDQVKEPGQSPLRTLTEVLEEHIAGIITGLHILPFFPYSSDDGFSVIDYTVVDPALGDWADVERLGRSFRLMFDAVINHISAQSEWARAFRAGDSAYEDYFITVEPGTDLSQVVRPRAKPLLTPVEAVGGERLVWTTFSPDQFDLNYANPEVLLEIIDVLLLYVEKGAEVIRLDAIAYLWKELGTSCIHLEETHRVVKLFRAIFDAVAPGTILITETNVPHEENVSYFGDGADEAQMVYQFPLPPLVLHAFHAGDATKLSEWAAELSTPSDSTTFFNFLASHDGVGVRPVEGILSQLEVQALVERTLANGGYVSYKTNPDGSRSVYELNISYFDALCDPDEDEPLDLQARRFLTSQAIMLSLAGVPGIYVHSLFGSRSYRTGVERTERYRSINREKFRREELERSLADPSSLRHRLFYPYLHLIRTRAAHPAFHPNGAQRVIFGNKALFTLLRTAPDGDEHILCIHNASGLDQPLRIDLEALSFRHRGELLDLLSGKRYPVESDGELTLLLDPYQVIWLG